MIKNKKELLKAMAAIKKEVEKLNDVQEISEEKIEDLENELEINEDDLKAEMAKSGENMQEISEDEDMPEPQTRSYETYLVPTQKFVDVIQNTIGTLPFNTILGTLGGSTIKLNDLMTFINSHLQKISIDEMNQIIGFIATGKYSVVRPFMEIVEVKERQGELWRVVQG